MIKKVKNININCSYYLNMSEDKIKIYHLTPDYKKCTYQTEQWNNILSNGKCVRFEITNYFYWGTFVIELTDNEKEEILKKDSIILNDYRGVSIESLDSGCDYLHKIYMYLDGNCRRNKRIVNIFSIARFIMGSRIKGWYSKLAHFRNIWISSAISGAIIIIVRS